MDTFLLQDWRSVVIDPAVTDLVQSEPDWVDLHDFEDAMWFNEVRSITRGGADNVQLVLETAPTKDEKQFFQMAAPLNLDPLAFQPYVIPAILSQWTAGFAPLARWVRWRLHQDGVAGLNWGATFKVAGSVSVRS